MNRRDIEHLAGCMLGGAVGDALGAPVEFLSLDEIRRRFGPDGVTGVENVLDAGEGDDVARFTDDTQMTLFTAEGLLRADSRFADRGICDVRGVIHRAYLRWLYTQGIETKSYDAGLEGHIDGWLVTVPGLSARRAPGATCISALSRGRPTKDSKGCGGVMRVAPVGLMADAGSSFELGCDSAAITHGHPSGFLSAGCLALMITKIIEGNSLRDAIEASVEELKKHPDHEECLEHVLAAEEIAADETASPGHETVERLGKGWVAEEALAISIYCSIVAGDDFARGVRLAINHSGDSDSTGAITGNILGALLGRGAIPEGWIERLEMRDVIEEVAADLLSGFREEPGWWQKYPPW